MFKFHVEEDTAPKAAGYERDRITVWRQTQEKYKNTKPAAGSIKFKEAIHFDAPKYHTFTSTPVRFVNRCMIDEAIDLKAAGSKPVVLNMADWKQPGGCVEAGSGAQEEECFRRSNYFLTLTQEFYPMETFDTVYSPEVEYYRKGANDAYCFMDEPVKINMIAAPAICFPPTTRDRKFIKDEKQVEIMKEKIHRVLRIAALTGNDTPVLSAWGCGAFGCPPYHIAKIFKEVCAQYDGVFKEIVFAILGANYKIFKAAYEE